MPIKFIRGSMMGIASLHPSYELAKVERLTRATMSV
jgi:hypothetical protein